MQIEILIDRFTDCLVERKTGQIVKTNYIQRETPIQKKDYSGWKFDWSIPQKMAIPYTNYLLMAIILFKEG